jgi:hypothetical protein
MANGRQFHRVDLENDARVIGSRQRFARLARAIRIKTYKSVREKPAIATYPISEQIRVSGAPWAPRGGFATGSHEFMFLNMRTGSVTAQNVGDTGK